MAKRTKAQEAERQQAIAELRELIKPGDTVNVMLEHVSSSGVSRSIRVIVPFVADGGRIDFLHPNHLVAVVLGVRRAKKSEGVIMSGCGMDMGFALVYELSHALYPEYKCLGKGKCPSNYHVNHRDTIQCQGTTVYNPDGPDPGEPCRWERGKGWVIDGELCPTCGGKGRVPNPEGPERFDLVHTDGYALTHRWL